jgi:purine-binding chemotaxis protein CheW
MTAAVAANGEISTPDLGSRRGDYNGRTAGAEATEFISFAVGDEQYGVNIMAVREIKDWSAITQLPNQPDYMRGVLNLRGVIVPIIDLRCRFGNGLTDATPMHVIIVIQIDGDTVGLLADRVLDIIAVDHAQIQPVPKVSQDARNSFLSGLVAIDKTMTALIDLKALLTAQVPAHATAQAQAQAQDEAQAQAQTQATS